MDNQKRIDWKTIVLSVILSIIVSIATTSINYVFNSRAKGVEEKKLLLGQLAGNRAYLASLLNNYCNAKLNAYATNNLLIEGKIGSAKILMAEDALKTFDQSSEKYSNEFSKARRDLDSSIALVDATYWNNEIIHAKIEAMNVKHIDCVLYKEYYTGANYPEVIEKSSQDFYRYYNDNIFKNIDIIVGEMKKSIR